MDNQKELAPVMNISAVKAAQPHSTELSAEINIVYPETVEECHKMIESLEAERLNRNSAIANMGDSFVTMSGCCAYIASGICDPMEILKLSVGMKNLLDNFHSNIQQIK